MKEYEVICHWFVTKDYQWDEMYTYRANSEQEAKAMAIKEHSQDNAGIEDCSFEVSYCQLAVPYRGE